MPRKKLQTEVRRYLLGRALRGKRTEDDVRADLLYAEISKYAIAFTSVVGSKISADYLEHLAHLIRRADIYPSGLNPLARGLLDYKRPAHRPAGSRSARTGYDYGLLYLAQKRAGWTIAQIARHAMERNTDPHDARLTIQAWRARVTAAINSAMKQEQVREEHERTSKPLDLGNLPRVTGLLDLAAALSDKK